MRYLQKAAESAVHDLQTGIAQSASVAKSELVLAIYELGVCFRHGWGVSLHFCYLFLNSKILTPFSFSSGSKEP